MMGKNQIRFPFVEWNFSLTFMLMNVPNLGYLKLIILPKNTLATEIHGFSKLTELFCSNDDDFGKNFMHGLWTNLRVMQLQNFRLNKIKSLALFFQRRISMLNWFLRRIRFSIPTGRLELFMLSIEFVMVYSFLWFCCGFDFRLIVKCLLYFTYRRQIWCRNITLPEKSGNIFCKRKFFRIHH